MMSRKKLLEREVELLAMEVETLQHRLTVLKGENRTLIRANETLKKSRNNNDELLRWNVQLGNENDELKRMLGSIQDCLTGRDFND